MLKYLNFNKKVYIFKFVEKKYIFPQLYLFL